MPYPFNSPRWEFTAADRTTMHTIATSCAAGLQNLVRNQLLNTNYVYQITGPNKTPRSTFDQIATSILALAPTYNAGNTPPIVDIIYPIV